MKTKTVIVASLAALLAVSPLLPRSTPMSDPPPAPPVLQQAVNAYAAIGIQTSCASYETRNIGTTDNPGGILQNNVCLVNGQWVDANLSAAMTADQLAATVKANGTGPPAVGFGAGDASTKQVSGIVSGATNTSTQTTGSSGSYFSNAPTKVVSALATGCGIDGMFASILTGGGSTEMTQTCNFGQLAAQVQLAIRQSMHLPNLSTYRSFWPTWYTFSAGNTYGHNSGWIANANGELNAYRMSAMTRPDLGWMLAQMHSSQQDDLRRQVSRNELSDGVTASTLNTIGGIRSTAAQTTDALAKLDATVHSEADADNTQVAVANKTALASNIIAHQNERLTQLQVAIAQQQALQAAEARDRSTADMSMIAERIARQSEVSSESKNASDIIARYRGL